MQFKHMVHDIMEDKKIYASEDYVVYWLVCMIPSSSYLDSVLFLPGFQLVVVEERAGFCLWKKSLQLQR